MIKFILALLLLCTFSSCGSLNIEKRKHTNGFYLSSAKTYQKVEKSITVSPSEGKDIVENTSFAFLEKQILTNPIIIDSTYRDKSIICDTIVLRNGAILSVHILEKNDSTLMYSLCEGEDDSEVMISLETIKAIKYKEGNIEGLSQKNETSKNKFDDSKKEENIFVFILLTILSSIGLTLLAGILLGLALFNAYGIVLSLLVFLIVALCFYLFLLMLFRNREKPKFLLFYALLFGVPFGIISYFLFN